MEKHEVMEKIRNILQELAKENTIVFEEKDSLIFDERDVEIKDPMYVEVRKIIDDSKSIKHQ
jgi:hypothetical protein